MSLASIVYHFLATTLAALYSTYPKLDCISVLIDNLRYFFMKTIWNAAKYIIKNENEAISLLFNWKHVTKQSQNLSNQIEIENIYTLI